MSNEQVVYIPVKAGFEMACEGETTWKLYTSEGDIGVVDSADRKNEHYLYARPHGLYLCQATTVPAAASVTSDIGTEALNMLRWVVEAYHPQWYYTMEKTGYECAFCKSMFKTSKEFMDTSDHSIGCQWAQAKAWLSTVTQEGKGNERTR